MASLIIGINTLLDTNPGESLTVTGVFPRDFDRASVVACVWSEVANPRTISTRFIIGTGFMKCIPMILPGRFVAEAIFVMEIEEVFEARMTLGGAIVSRSLNIFSLAS